MKDTKKIFSNTIYQVVAKIITSIFGIIVIYLLTRYLHEIGFSEYSFIFTFTGFIFIFADFGFGTLLTRSHAVKEDKKDVQK